MKTTRLIYLIFTFIGAIHFNDTLCPIFGDTGVRSRIQFIEDLINNAKNAQDNRTKLIRLDEARKYIVGFARDYKMQQEIINSTPHVKFWENHFNGLKIPGQVYSEPEFKAGLTAFNWIYKFWVNMAHDIDNDIIKIKSEMKKQEKK